VGHPAAGSVRGEILAADRVADVGHDRPPRRPEVSKTAITNVSPTWAKPPKAPCGPEVELGPDLALHLEGVRNGSGG
jgi:hypothetical protein